MDTSDCLSAPSSRMVNVLIDRGILAMKSHNLQTFLQAHLFSLVPRFNSRTLFVNYPNVSLAQPRQCISPMRSFGPGKSAVGERCHQSTLLCSWLEEPQPVWSSSPHDICWSGYLKRQKQLETLTATIFVVILIQRSSFRIQIRLIPKQHEYLFIIRPFEKYV